MKRAIIMAAALCVLCSVAALGAVTARGSSPVEVSLPGCYFGAASYA